MNKIIWKFDNLEFEKSFIGPVNQNLGLINTELSCNITHINNCLLIDDEYSIKEDVIFMVINVLYELFIDKISIQERDLIHIINIVKNSANLEKTKEELLRFYKEKTIILTTYEGKKIYAKTYLQKLYIELLNKSSIMFVTGSAGSGKTYLACAYAINELKHNNIKKIIITRPVVEAGEKLGFLPGDLKEKVDPYLVPIYDCLKEFLGAETMDKMIEKNIIEIAPLAYMRGRTLDHSIIILDEAQNTTSNQMKMFLTRLGFNSKMIITGDLSQIDLQKGIRSGLIEATNLLQEIPGISLLEFKASDVMRHPLVSKIISRYESVSKDDSL